MGAVGVGGFIAQWSLWCLLVWGWVTGELDARRTVVFLALWLVGFVSLPLLPLGNELFMPFVALLDVSLVLLLFKGDVRITERVTRRHERLRQPYHPAFDRANYLPR